MRLIRTEYAEDSEDEPAINILSKQRLPARAPSQRRWARNRHHALRRLYHPENKQRRACHPRPGDTLLDGLLQPSGQNRLHQFVRSLEALILPKIGKTKQQFTHRCCQTFARAGDDTRSLLQEAFDMRSATEHLHPRDKAVQNYPIEQRETICWQRIRQLEHLACDAYSRVLRNVELRKHFLTDDAIANFWKLPDDQRLSLWGDPLDVTLEPLVQERVTF